MAYIQLDDTPVPLTVGDTKIGTARDALIRVPGPEQLGVLAVVTMSTQDQVVIRRIGSASVVKVNGVPLGAEPTPLIHGDKIDVAGKELLFGDERKAGGTQLISGMQMPALQASRAALAPKAGATSGGRLVSLVDGREYPVPPTGLTVGRDAGCDVVVPSNEVSRRHAEITAGDQGYVLNDLSTNGVFVNGERVRRTQILGRGDIVRIGNEEFRFYAEAGRSGKAASEAPPAQPAAGAAPAPPTATGAEAVAPPPPAPAPSVPLAAPAPGASPGVGADPRPVLATLEIINEGVHKGKRFELRTPLAHVGRGPHNDVLIGDESVSDTHAKLQRRGEHWYVIDMQSTNGTYVGGRRIKDEQELSGSPDLRFGGIKMRFVAAAAGDVAKETRAIAGMSAEQARKLSAQADAEARARVQAAVDEAGKPRSLPGWLWLLALMAIAVAVFFLLQIG